MWRCLKIEKNIVAKFDTHIILSRCWFFGFSLRTVVRAVQKASSSLPNPGLLGSALPVDVLNCTSACSKFCSLWYRGPNFQVF